MNVKVLPLKGYKSLRALNAFSTLVMGLKMTPMHMHTDYVTFFESFKTKTAAETEESLRTAASIVALEQDEIDALVSFAADANGIPYGAANIENLSPADLFEVVIAVCLEISKIKIDLVTNDEKKK